MKCFDCGKFFTFVSGVAWKTIYNGYPPTPDRVIYKCKKCADKNGGFEPEDGIRPDYSCGFFR